MRKLIKGIVEFRSTVSPYSRENFARLALGQAPDTLFVACSDSRVAPNVFASTNPGDLFVVRNVGNMIPPCGAAGESEAAAIEFALAHLPVVDVVICGHSDCGAMRAIAGGRDVASPSLRAWLRHGDSGRGAPASRLAFDPELPIHDQYSQRNVLRQVANLRSYPIVQRALAAGKLRLHGWWFNIGRAEVLAYNEERGRFVVIDEAEAERILNQG